MTLNIYHEFFVIIHTSYIDVDITDIDKTCKPFFFLTEIWSRNSRMAVTTTNGNTIPTKAKHKHKHTNWKVNYSLIGFCMWFKLLSTGEK